MSFARIRTLVKKYSEVVVFGVTVGASAVMCANGAVSSCVSLVATLGQAVQ